MKLNFKRDNHRLIDRIRSGDEKEMERIYFKYRDEFVRWSISRFGIPEAEALDHYQDTLTIFFEKVMEGSLQSLESSIKTYLYGIGKNKLMQSYEQKKRQERHQGSVAEHYQFLATEEVNISFYAEAKQITEALFSQLGDKCQEILRLFYYEKKPMKEIAQIMGHNSEAVSRTTKKRCLEKIKSQLKTYSNDG